MPKRYYLFFLLIFTLFFLNFNFSIVRAEASAKLYFLPTSGTFGVGETIQVRVAVDTGGQARFVAEFGGI